MAIDGSYENGKKNVMKGSRQVLVKVEIFQLVGHGHPQADATATHSFFPDSKSFIFGLSIDTSFVL